MFKKLMGLIGILCVAAFLTVSVVNSEELRKTSKGEELLELCDIYKGVTVVGEAIHPESGDVIQFMDIDGDYEPDLVLVFAYHATSGTYELIGEGSVAEAAIVIANVAKHYGLTFDELYKGCRPL